MILTQYPPRRLAGNFCQTQETVDRCLGVEGSARVRPPHLGSYLAAWVGVKQQGFQGFSSGAMDGDGRKRRMRVIKSCYTVGEGGG